MKWSNHKVVGFSLPFLVTGNWFISVVSLFCSTLPDLVEGPKNNKFMRHRGSSHNPFIWLAATSPLVMYVYFSMDKYNEWLTSTNFTFLSPLLPIEIIIGFLAGVMSHLFGDMLTISGIPINPISKKRLAFKLFATGTYTEYIATYLIFFFAIAIQFLPFFKF